jgi:hypothetical protein
MAGRFQKRLLDQVGVVRFAAQSPADLNAGEQGQVAAVQVQQIPQGLAVATARAGQQLLRVKIADAVHQALYTTGNETTPSAPRPAKKHQRVPPIKMTTGREPHH